MALGLFTIVYWIIGEHYGSGDLRGYLLVQFLPMLIMPIILLMKITRAKKYHNNAKKHSVIHIFYVVTNV
jgi:hypothetical protein